MENFRSFRPLAVSLVLLTFASVVRANTAPTAQCTDITANAGSDCEILVSINDGSYDPDGDPVSITQSPAGPYPLGTTLVTLRITDGGGLWDQCQATVTVEDNTPPVVTCPNGIIRVECGQPTDPSHTGYATLTDNCDASPVLTYEDTEIPNNAQGPLIMTIYREWIGTDASGNVGDCFQPILIYDNTPPYFAYCPEDLTISCDESTDPSNTGQAVGTDYCQVDLDLWYEDEVVAGDCPYEVTRNRTWHLSDRTGADNATCLQVISVIDIVPPQITCPEPISVPTLADIPNPDPGSVTVVDACDPDPQITFTADIRITDCPLTLERTYLVTDACGNTATCKQTIIIEIGDDITPPIITDCPSPIQVECTDDIPPPDMGAVTATDNCDANPLVEHVTDISDGQTCPETITRTYSVTDAAQNTVSCSQLITVHDQRPPVCTFPQDQTVKLCQPEPICLPLGVSDNCSAETTLQLIDGPGEIVDGQWCYEATSSTSFEVTVRATDNCDNYCEDIFQIDIMLNTPPRFTGCPGFQELHWGERFEFDFTAADPDVGQTLSFSLCEDAPQGVTIVQSTGHLEWNTGRTNICDPILCVTVTDDCGATATCEIEACVSNDPPVISCPDDQTICSGFPFSSQVTAEDPDNGPSAFFRLVGGPAGLTVGRASGEIVWEDPVPGTYEVCIEAHDGAPVCDPCSPAAVDRCCFVLNVMALDIVIEKIHGQIQGQYTEVGIDFLHQGSNWPIGGYDFLVQYDASALSFVMAREGQFLIECEWEYFTYRFGAGGNCSGGCPSGVLRVIAVAESTGGSLANRPDCYTNDGEAVPGPGSSTSTELALLKFLVSNDRTLECSYVPIRFVWYDCGDNGLASLGGDTLYVSNMVFDYADEQGDPPIVQWSEITGQDNSFPTVTGAPSPACNLGDKTESLRCANFYNGGVDIICADEIDAPGDVNINGIGYEIADAVMFTNYFVNGLSSFEPHVEGSIAATDANRDGLALSIADLVYLIRVVIGDAMPYAKVNPVGEQVAYTLDSGVLAVTGDIDISGAALVVRGDVEPHLLVDNMILRYAFDGVNTRLVVTPPLDAPAMVSFRGEFIGGIDRELISLELATSEGAMVLAKNVPVRYRLSQNYPNPFNPVTTIEFALPEPTNYSLAIFNIQGQVVGTHEGRAGAAGVYRFAWDATEHASGVYFYRLEAGDFAMTRKMLLLK